MQPDNKEEVVMVNNDQVREQADAELTASVAQHTGQKPEEVTPPSALRSDLEAHKSGIPQFKEVPRVNQKAPAPAQAGQINERRLQIPGDAVTKIVGQEVRGLQRGVTGEHIEEPPSFQPAKTVLDLHSKRTLKKAA